MNMDHKKCKSCCQDKPLHDFYKNHLSCKECIARKLHSKAARRCCICTALIPYERHGSHVCSDTCRKTRERNQYHQGNGRQKAQAQRERRRTLRPDVVKAASARRNAKRYANPSEKIRRSMTAAVSRALGGGRCGYRFTSILGYQIDALRSHMERQFEPGMTWDNYGHEWQIDHIKPVSWFKFKTTTSKSFRECWAMSNLAPRWRTTEIARRYGSRQLGNVEKSNKFEGGGMQPTLFDFAQVAV